MRRRTGLEEDTMDHAAATALAEAHTAACNSGFSEAVAAFCAEDGGIVINRGAPWLGRGRVMALVGACAGGARRLRRAGVLRRAASDASARHGARPARPEGASRPTIPP